MKIRRERVPAAPAQACFPQRSSRVDRDPLAFGAQRQRNFQLPGSRLRASVEVRNQVSHPLRLDSGRSSNRHLSPSVNTSRLVGTDLARFPEARFWTTFALRAGYTPVLISPLALRALRPNRHLRPQQEM